MRKGTKHSIESIEKFKKVAKVKYTSEVRRKMSESAKRNMTQDMRDRISKAKTGAKLSLLTRQKMSETRKGKPHSLQHNQAVSLSKKGSKNYNWKGGATSEVMLARNGLQYRLWRKAIFERDNYQCVIGGKEHGSQLEADHIKSFARFPELRFELLNGRTLCKACHRKTDNYAGRSKGRCG